MARQYELADLAVGLLPLPDETLFSWCSRYHRLAANGLDRTTCLQLFGHHRAGTAHDFPARLGELSARAGGKLGTATEIIEQRTLLPYYLPFRPCHLGQEAVQALSGGGIGHLKYRLGLLTSGLGAAHPLKSCSVCIDADLDRYGWAYWHRVHQWPGVWICPQHRQPLWISPQKLNQLARFVWALPSPDARGSVACLSGVATGSDHVEWLLKLATMCSTLPDNAAGSFDDPYRIGLIFRQRIAGLGMCTASGRVRWDMVDPVLRQLADRLGVLPELSHQADPLLLRSQLLRLLSGRSLSHPLRILVWMATWFDDFGEFRHAYAALEAPVDELDQAVVDMPSRPPMGPAVWQQSVLRDAIEKRISLTAAARQAQVTYATMAAWASAAAIELPRRPQKLHAPIWEAIVEQLRQGADKDAVASTFGVAVVTVTRVLRTVTGLQDQWHTVRHARRRAHARSTWTRIKGLHAYMGLRALRRMEPAAYAWLYRNDRNWLDASARDVPRLGATNHAPIRIENADARMASALYKLAVQYPKVQSWRLEVLRNSMPRIDRAIRAPERWPQTIKALNFILGRLEENP
jgi:hypothetical protein